MYHRPSSVVRHPSSSVVRCPSSVVCRPSPVIRRPSPVARHPLSVVRSLFVLVCLCLPSLKSKRRRAGRPFFVKLRIRRQTARRRIKTAFKQTRNIQIHMYIYICTCVHCVKDCGVDICAMFLPIFCFGQHSALGSHGNALAQTRPYPGACSRRPGAAPAEPAATELWPHPVSPEGTPNEGPMGRWVGNDQRSSQVFSKLEHNFHIRPPKM